MDVDELEPVRWYRVTLDHGEPFKESLRNFAEERLLDFAWLQVVGELEEGKIASGYESNDPDEKMMNPLDGNRHVVGVGSLRRGDDGEPTVHVHGPTGRDTSTLTGCWGGEFSVYRGLEVLVVQLTTP